MEIDKVILKVRKLLELSKSSSQHESAAAVGIANKLIDEYRLSQADLEATTQSRELPEEDVDSIYETGKITQWKASLVRILTHHYGVSYWLSLSKSATGRKYTKFRLVGRKSDILIARYMFGWIVSECQRLSDIFAKGKGRVYVGRYCDGFVAGIAEKLIVSRNEAKKEAPSGAIILLDSRLNEAKSLMYRLHTNLETIKSKSTYQSNDNAYGLGKISGKNLSLEKAPKALS